MSESMYKIKLQKQITELRQIVEDNDKFLKKLNIDVQNIPDNLKTTVNEVVKFYSSAGLNELNLEAIQEWYLLKNKHLTDTEFNVLYPLNIACADLEYEIEKETKTIRELEESIAQNERDQKSAKDIQSKLKDIESENKDISKKKANLLKPPSYLDIDELIALEQNVEKFRKNKNMN